MSLKTTRCTQFVLCCYAQNWNSCKNFIYQRILMKFVGNFIFKQDLYSTIGYFQICWGRKITLWYLLLVTISLSKERNGLRFVVHCLVINNSQTTELTNLTSPKHAQVLLTQSELKTKRFIQNWKALHNTRSLIGQLSFLGITGHRDFIHLDLEWPLSALIFSIKGVLSPSMWKNPKEKQ